MDIPNTKLFQMLKGSFTVAVNWFYMLNMEIIHISDIIVI